MRGVRWLGPSARVVSFSSEKTQHGYRNNPIGRLELGRDFARLEGFVPGQAAVGARHSILAIALRDVRRDTEKYLARDTIDRLAAELEAAGIPVS